MIDSSLVNLAELGVLVVGVVLALQQLRDIKETRQTELETRQIETYLDWMRRVQNKEWIMAWADVRYSQEWEDLDNWIEKYGARTNPEAYSNWAVTMQFYECLGLLVRRKIVDIDLIYEHVGGIATIGTWERVEPIVKGWRERVKSPTMWDSFEYLYNKLKKLEQQSTTR
jgi:hypothetical protein